MPLLRSAILHTPKNPFTDEGALEVYPDGGLLVENGRIGALGPYAEIRAQHPQVETRDLRGGVLLPGFVDTHVHYPQVRVIGGLGMPLLEWLEANTLPEEARLADAGYAQEVAREFVHGLASHGTTTALVFGAHFREAQAALFEEARRIGLRVVSGMVLSDRLLRPELHQTPEQAHADSSTLIRRFHGKDDLLYAVTPRFSLSASEAILEVCQTLQQEHAGLRFTSHINENGLEIATVRELFPWASDYLHTYERFGLVHRHSVLAHNLHPSDSELQRMGAAQATAAHCPCSNAALGSGFFPLRRHLRAGVRVALGTDIGGGTGFCLLKEALQAFFLQSVMPGGEGYLMSPAHMLYLITRAGAEALGLEDQTGDLRPGKSADLVYLRPPEGSPLEAVLRHSDSLERALSGIFALAGADCIAEVYRAGRTVYRQAHLTAGRGV
ncbi:MAG: guanine deaminase [Meiothermus sp.]|nr:guanine deaminase [Meiothermus sp.]